MHNWKGFTFQWTSIPFDIVPWCHIQKSDIYLHFIHVHDIFQHFPKETHYHFVVYVLGFIFCLLLMSLPNCTHIFSLMVISPGAEFSLVLHYCFHLPHCVDFLHCLNLESQFSAIITWTLPMYQPSLHLHSRPYPHPFWTEMTPFSFWTSRCTPILIVAHYLFLSPTQCVTGHIKYQKESAFNIYITHAGC